MTSNSLTMYDISPPIHYCPKCKSAFVFTHYHYNVRKRYFLVFKKTKLHYIKRIKICDCSSIIEHAS